MSNYTTGQVYGNILQSNQFGHYSNKQYILSLASGNDDSNFCVGLDFYLSDNATPSAIVMNLSDGNSIDFFFASAAKSGTKISLSLSPGELIKSWQFFPRPDGANVARVGGWVITTTLNQKCTVGTLLNGNLTPILPENLGSGFFVGFSICCAGNEVNFLGIEPYFLKQYTSISMSPMQFGAAGNSTNLQTYTNPITVAESVVTNQTTKPQDWSFNDSISKETSHEWKTSSAMMFGASVTASAGFLDIVDVKATAEWSFTTTQTTTDSVTDTTQISWGVNGTIDPNWTVKATAAVWQGVLSLPYYATVTITMAQTGLAPLKFTDRGVYTSVQYTSAHITLTEFPPSTLSAAPTATISDHIRSRLLPIDPATAQVEGNSTVPVSRQMLTTKHPAPVQNGLGRDLTATKLCSPEKAAGEEKEDKVANELRAIGQAISSLLQSNSIAAQ